MTETASATGALRWEYEWGDDLNAVLAPTAEPPLPKRIVDELVRGISTGTPAPTIFVRGELGIGKTTLAGLMTGGELQRGAQGADSDALKNSLMTCRVIEAGDLESPTDFAARVNALRPAVPAVVLARPGMMDAAAQWINRSPIGTVTIAPFAPTSAVFQQCLEEVARLAGLPTIGDPWLELRALAGNLPEFLHTPFFFRFLADTLVYTEVTSGGFVATDARRAAVQSTSRPKRRLSALELFSRCIEARLGQGAFGRLLRCAMDPGLGEDVDPIPGILLASGRFAHDGYRTVVLAVAALERLIVFEELCSRPKGPRLSE